MLLMISVSAGATTVAIQGRRLIVNGSQFTVKGVCYSPVRAGFLPGAYDWMSDTNNFTNDFPQIVAMGANTLRTYANSSNDTYVANMLNAAAAAGLYVIMGYSVSYTDFSNPANRAATVNDFTIFVNKWKGYPAILAWCFGNEANLNTPNKNGWYTLLEQAAVAAHAAEGASFHPVMTACADASHTTVAEAMNYDSSLPALDIWGLNVYTGRSFGNLYTTYTSTKPYILTEWGSDGYDGRIPAPSESLQSDIVSSAWRELSGHFSVTYSTEKCMGGVVFEWSDEWWKGCSTPGDPATAGTGGYLGASVQDTATDWQNANYDDPNIQEEWWGMVGISSGTHARTIRQVYRTLSGLWGGAAANTVNMNLQLKRLDNNNTTNQIFWDQAGIQLGTTTWRRADAYIFLTSTITAQAAVRIYTDNRSGDANPAYTGTGSAAGLVCAEDTSQLLPLVWRATQVSTNTLSIRNTADWSNLYVTELSTSYYCFRWMTDIGNSDWPGDASDYNWVKNYANGTHLTNGSDWGLSWTWTDYKDTYIYLGALFTNAAIPRHYRTSRIIVESFVY